MTVHNSTDALAAEMLALGAAARDAARAMREASDETKNKALLVAAAAIRAAQRRNSRRQRRATSKRPRPPAWPPRCSTG